MRDRWAGDLLSWEFRPPLLIAETSAARYFVKGERHEVLAHAEIRDTCGHRRVEVGSFRDVGAAKAACEADAQMRVRAGDRDERPPVSVAIGRSRGGGAPRGNRNAAKRKADRVRPADAGDLDAALAAVAWATEEEG